MARNGFDRGDGQSPQIGNRPLTRKQVIVFWLFVGITLAFSVASAVVAVRWLL